MLSESEILIGWTTLGDKALADSFAAKLVETGLAVCVQIEGEVISHYLWEGKQCREGEYRLMIKFRASEQEELQNFIDVHHPYDIPEWLVVSVKTIGSAYRAWALSSPSER